MPYCPQCLDEFQEWVKVCPDCNGALVAELPTQPEYNYSNEPLVYITKAPNEPLGMMWKEILENEGIHSLLINRSGLSAYTRYSHPLDYELHVLASQVEKAKEILAPFLEN